MVERYVAAQSDPEAAKSAIAAMHPLLENTGEPNDIGTSFFISLLTKANS
jgi:hypothetical protein